MNQQKFNIMIVEDNEQNQMLLSMIIKQMNCEVYIANNGKQALQNEMLEFIDLILLDINMPEMDGYETCKLLKENNKTKEIPVIFISALATTSDIVKGFQSGGVDYIPKPLQIEEVRARINVHLQLKQKTDVLDKTIGTLIKTQEELYKSKKLASLGVLTAGLAHEINNPVNFIYTGINSLQQDYSDIEPILKMLNEKIKCDCPDFYKLNDLKKDIELDEILRTIPQTIEDIKYGASRTSEIIAGLRNFSRVDTDSKQLTNIHESIDSAILLLKNKHKKDITIIKDYDENVHEVMAFPGEINQVFLNIINNAIDSLSGFDGKDRTDGYKKQITIRTRKLKKLLEVSVYDNGPGISEDILDSIFDPFFTTKKTGEGTGLGLSISYGIIDKHKGKIDVESDVGQGTEFRIVLPL